MSSQALFKLAITGVIVTFCVAAFFAWRADQRDRAQLAAELAATKQLLAAADSRQHDRDSQLAQTLAALAAEKRTVVTPAQIASELSKTIPLPNPIALQTASSSVSEANTQQSAIDSPVPKNISNIPAQAVIPAEDLKPLYDFSLDCKACQAKLVAAQGDLTDERAKTASLTKERDDALRIAKGGSAWRRIGRAAKWFLIGAAAGAILSRAH